MRETAGGAHFIDELFCVLFSLYRMEAGIKRLDRHLAVYNGIVCEMYCTDYVAASRL